MKRFDGCVAAMTGGVERPRRVQQRMEVIAHLAIGEHLGSEPVQRPRDDPELCGPVFIIAVDRLAPVAARSDIVVGGGGFDAKWGA